MSLLKYLGAMMLAASAAACSNSASVTAPIQKPIVHDTIFHPTYALPLANDTSDFAQGMRTGTISDNTLPEASGLAASRHYPGWFWTHNDSGNPNTIFLIDSLGTVRATFSISNASNRDWEDICIGPGPDPTLTYIYLGEIGDNNDFHQTSSVYRFPEPTIAVAPTHVTASIDNAVKIEFTYPDGPGNAETLMLDPLTKDLYIAGKSGVAYLYIIPYPQRTDTIVTLKELAVLPLSTLTAGDISASGLEIVMKNYNEIYYWKRTATQSILQTLLGPPRTLPYIVEPKGEGMCFTPNDNAICTTGERLNGVLPGIYRYIRK